MHADILRTLILSDPTASALLGATRIYPVKLPQAPIFPALVMQGIHTERVESFDGPSGLARPRVQLDMYASTYDAAKALSEAVRVKINGYRGPESQRIALVDDEEGYDAELKLYRQRADYYVWHEESR